MSEIVYYDANATVRSLMTRLLSNYGLKVVNLPALDQCEEVLARCTHPVIFIVDLSRQPEMLTRLQAVVPKYIRDPERCILTSVTPTSLARFLPKKIEECFFKHVVERPFKRLDFIQFFESVAHPYLKDAAYREPPHSAMNSSVSQITGQYPQRPEDAGLQHQVDGIVQSTSRSIPLQRLKEDADERNVIASGRRESRISKTGRNRAFAGVPQKVDKQAMHLSEEDDRRIRENLNAWRNASSSRQSENTRANMSAIHKSRVEKVEESECATMPVQAPGQVATMAIQAPGQVAAVPKSSFLSPDMEIFENSRTRPTQIPPNVAMRHPDLETIYPDLQPDAVPESPKQLSDLSNVPDERQTLPSQAPTIENGLPIHTPKRPSSHQRAAVSHLGSRSHSAEPVSSKPSIAERSKAAEPVPSKPSIAERSKAAEPVPAKPSVPVKSAGSVPHARATIPGKDRHRPTVIPESVKEVASSPNTGPTETRAQIIGHLSNFSHVPYKGRATGRGSKPDVGRVHGASASPVSSKVHETKSEQASSAVQTQTPAVVESPKAEMVEMSSITSGTNSPARQHAPAARRQRAQSLGNLSSIIKSELKLPEKHADTSSEVGQDQPKNGAQPRVTHTLNPYLKRQQASRHPSISKTEPVETPKPAVTSEEAVLFDEDSLKSDTNHILEAIEDGSRAIGEDENTLIVSPVLLNDIEPMPNLDSPSLIQKPVLQSLTPILQTRMSLTVVLQVLQRSMLENTRITMSCRDGAKMHVAILEAGRMLWFEPILAGRVSDAASYLKGLEDTSLPSGALLEQMQQKKTLLQAFSALDLDVTAIELCEKQLTAQIQNLHALNDKPVDIHREVPLPWQPLLSQRPCQSLPASPILFNEFRKYAEEMTLPRNFHYMSFAMRPYRTPLNVAIDLTAEENELLTAIKCPRSITELQKAGKPQCMTMLYRLVMFGFADCVN